MRLITTPLYFEILSDSTLCVVKSQNISKVDGKYSFPYVNIKITFFGEILESN